ncbi:Hypothetical predicted protein [Cloeon dipterum]|uniref:GH16 domain-containing protein n=2 Tax=Cloeon dipterum TaxID=197152 RepID=A0A8S1CN05_9INSE|nr:Hypothetical predicted protein [Cloeon dipterum]
MLGAKQVGVLALLAALAINSSHQQGCEPSITRTNKGGTVCKGVLIFSDEFDTLDLDTWQHEITLAGGGNWEFQMYYNNRSNSYVKDSKLFIKPGLTSDQYGEAFLSSGVLNLHNGNPADQCTNPAFFGCERSGNPSNLLNPIKSARLRTANSFTFQYGQVEVRAKMPAGDWLWPAAWLLPAKNAYGTWPASGEIDITESRGNLNLVLDGKNIGTEMTGATLHFGPYVEANAYETAHFEKNTAAGQGYDKDFHNFQLEWTPDFIRFGVDGEEIGRIDPGPGGFWEYGGFAANLPEVDNPWRFGTKMAPFDQQFFIVLNVATGGVAYFPDTAQNPGGKPWVNTSPTAAADFWNGRGQWLPTWNLDVNDAESAAMQIDYVKVWAL